MRGMQNEIIKYFFILNISWQKKFLNRIIVNVGKDMCKLFPPTHTVRAIRPLKPFWRGKMPVN